MPVRRPVMPKARGARHPDAAAKLAFTRNFLGRDLRARSQVSRRAAQPALAPLHLYDAGGVRAVSSKTLRIYNNFERIVNFYPALKRTRQAVARTFRGLGHFPDLALNRLFTLTDKSQTAPPWITVLFTIICTLRARSKGDCRTLIPLYPLFSLAVAR